MSPEGLMRAAGQVVKALEDKGKVPWYHDAIQHRHSKEWPALHRALEELRRQWKGDQR